MILVKSKIDYAKVSSAGGGWTIAEREFPLSNRMGLVIKVGTHAIDYNRFFVVLKTCGIRIDEGNT